MISAGADGAGHAVMSDVDLSIFDEEEKKEKGQEDGLVEKMLSSAQEVRHEGAVLKVAIDIPPPRELPPDQVFPVLREVLEHYNVEIPPDIVEKLEANDYAEQVFLVAADDAELRPRKVTICLDPEIRTLSIRGEAPLNGLDSFVETFIDYEVKAGKLREDGSIDFREINRFPQAREGDLLVRLYEPTAGVPGIDIFGKPIEPRPGRAISISKGEGVVKKEGFDEEKSRHIEEFVAEKPGVVICEFEGEVRAPEKLRKISVQNKIEVINVDFTTGNLGSELEEIRCMADVVVKGDIKGQFSVIVDGNLEVHGSVEGQKIDVSKTFSAIFVKSNVKAGKNITVGSCLNAQLDAKEFVLVQRECSQSRVAGEKIFFKPKGVPYVLCGMAHLQGHQIYLEGINVRNILTIELAPELFLELKKLSKKLKAAETALETWTGRVKDRVAILVSKMQLVQQNYKEGPIIDSLNLVRGLVTKLLKGEVTTERVKSSAAGLHSQYQGKLKGIAKGVEAVVVAQERLNETRHELEEYRSQIKELEERLHTLEIKVMGTIQGNGTILVQCNQQELSWSNSPAAPTTKVQFRLKYVPGEGLIQIG